MLQNLPAGISEKVVYSDDILLVLKSIEEFKLVLKELDNALAIFNLSLDHAKTQYIRFGGIEEHESVSLWPKPIKLEVSKSMKWLGFFLFDNDVFNPTRHSLQR